MGRESFMPLFFGDFLASTYTWDGEEQGLYLLLLGYQWTNGMLPTDVKRLAKAVRYEQKRFITLWETVRTKFEEAGGGLINRRLEEHRAHSVAVGERKSIAGRAGASARWRTDGSRIADALPPHSEGMSSANGSGNGIHPIHPNIPPKPPGGGWGDCPDGVDPEAWTSWGGYKRGKPAKGTITEMANLLREFPAETQRAMVSESVRNGWRGCFPLKSQPKPPSVWE